MFGQLSQHRPLCFSLSAASDFVTTAKVGALGEDMIHKGRKSNFIKYGTFKVGHYCRYYIAMVPKWCGTLVCHVEGPDGQILCYSYTLLLQYTAIQ